MSFSSQRSLHCEQVRSSGLQTVEIRTLTGERSHVSQVSLQFSAAVKLSVIHAGVCLLRLSSKQT